LPGSFESTIVGNEAKMFKYKDTIFVLDDFAPKGLSNDIAQSHKEYDRLIRSMSNQSGRDKMNKDNELATGKYPRCAIISTGEDTPMGESLRTRLVVIEIQGYKKETAGDIDKQLLSELTDYASGGGFSQVMSSYIQYISKNYDRVKKDNDKVFNEYRKKFNNDNYGRTIDNAVNIFIGISIFLKFAFTKNILTADEAKKIRSRHEEILMDYLDSNKEAQASEDPVDRFIELLRSALSSGDAYICEFSGGVPQNGMASALGWTVSAASDISPFAKGKKIGWLHNNNIYLLPEEVYSLIVEKSRKQGKAFEVTQRTINKRLSERGILVQTKERKNKGKAEKRLTISKTIEGANQNVIVIDSKTLGIVEQISEIDDENLGMDYKQEFNENIEDFVVDNNGSVTDISSVH